MKPFTDTLFIILQLIAPQHLLSRLIAKLAESKIPLLKNNLINLAVDVFNIDTSEAVSSNPNDYKTFNDFFTRELKPGLRPFDENQAFISSPSDGVVSQFGSIKHGKLIQAKGKYFSLNSLLGGDAQLSAAFEDGEFATIYLSPRDYHRVHMPSGGKLTKSLYVPGKLFSVNQTTAKNIDQLFARNERLVTVFETEHGPVAIILVGAMLVAGIETVWSGQIAPPTKTITTFDNNSQDVSLNKGDEMGRFKFGSTVILLFGKDKIAWLDNIEEGSFVKMGESLAKAN